MQATIPPCESSFTNGLLLLSRKSDISTSDVTTDIKKLLSMDYQKEWLLNKSLEDLKEAESRRVSRNFF